MEVIKRNERKKRKKRNKKPHELNAIEKVIRWLNIAASEMRAQTHTISFQCCLIGKCRVFAWQMNEDNKCLRMCVKEKNTKFNQVYVYVCASIYISVCPYLLCCGVCMFRSSFQFIFLCVINFIIKLSIYHKHCLLVWGVWVSPSLLLLLLFFRFGWKYHVNIFFAIPSKGDMAAVYYVNIIVQFSQKIVNKQPRHTT